MVIYLCGPDSYRRNKKLNELIAAYRQKYKQIDLQIFDLEEDPEAPQKAKEFIEQPSMFVDSKIALVKESGMTETKEWLNILKTNLNTFKTFILISDKTKPKKAFSFLLKKPVTSQYFEELKGLLLEAFLEKEIRVRKLNFSSEARRFFKTYLESAEEKTWLAINELDKIALANFPQPISKTDLTRFIHWTVSEKPFLIAGQILYSRGPRQKLGLLEKLLLQKEEPARIFNSLAYQARGKELMRLADYDIAIKSGKLEYEEALTDFVLS